MGSESGIPFGNYSLLKRIARGGMAEVFVARQKGFDGFDRTVAIKRILPHLLDDQSFVRMFQEEARLAARLSHPNVIHIYDFGKVAEHFFIAMEFMHGVHAGDLIRMAAHEPIPAALIARIGADACAGLHYAHNRTNESGAPLQLVHRDVSPPNLLVSFDGVVKIVDFGIAKAVSSIEQTRPGVVKGKYAYMSPEQTMGQQLDGHSDVFSLALVLWEMLAGKPAVTRNDQIMAMKMIRDGKVPAIEDHREGLAPALCTAMANALHKDPRKRSNARTFGNELEAFVKASNQIATGMELGAWLSARVPPEDLSGEGNGGGTRQATSLGTPLASPQDDLLFEEPRSVRDAGTRGSVVARLSRDNQETRVLSVASGDLRTAQSRTFRPMSDGNSVVIDSDLIDGSSVVAGVAMHTATTRLLDSAVSVDRLDRPAADTSEGHGDFDSEEATRMDPRRAAPRDFYPLSLAVESGEEPTIAGGGPQTRSQQHEQHDEPPTTVAQDPPFAPVIPESLGPMGRRPLMPAAASHGFSGGFPAPTTAAPPFAPASPRKPFVIGALIIAVIGAFALLMNSEDKPAINGIGTADAGDLQGIPSNGFDAGMRVPVIVVTPLWDAAPATVDATPTAPNTAVLEITTRPPGARLKINGDDRGTSPATFSELPPGDVDVVVELDGYLPETRTVKLRDNQFRTLELALRVAPTVMPIPRDSTPRGPRVPKPAKEPGRLAVRTSPYSVVYLRDKKLGVTPLANLELAPGRYKLTFKNPDLKTVTRNVVIQSGKTTKLDFDLE